MNTLCVGERKVALFVRGSGPMPLVALTAEHGEAGAVFEEVARLTGLDFALAAIDGVDWDRELSPWPAPAAFKGGAAFGGGADGYLGELTEAILPSVEAELPQPPAARVLAGYSLAGLFALYALYQTAVFDGAVSASGSLWYPGFADFARERDMMRPPRAIYLSVGDREGRTRNPVLRPVEENTALLAERYAARGVETRYELNPGNHFDHPAERTAKGIAWAIKTIASPLVL